MDFATRDRYRHAVENVAKRSSCSEETVAEQAVELATQNELQHGVTYRSAQHVGFYLADKGLPRTGKSRARTVADAATASDGPSRKFPLTFYLGLIVLLTALFSVGLLAFAAREGRPCLGFGGTGFPDHSMQRASWQWPW